jgi:hypothetical protein
MQLAVAAAAIAAAAAAVLLVRRDWGHTSPPVLAVAPLITEAPITAHPLGQGARIVLSGAPVPLPEGGSLGAGSRVTTPTNGGANLQFATGTSATLAAWGDVTVVADGPAQLLRLDSGSIELHVAKLSAGQRFILDTPDAEVEVRGTQFRVSIVPADPSCGRGTWTRVFVTEGVVEVRHDGSVSRIAAGEQWPTDCGRTAIVDARQPHADTIVPRVHGGSPSSESTLRAQNNLFARAMAAKRRGDTTGTIALLERFLAKYPTSPLAESVMVERMRLIRTEDPARGSVAAAQYLTRYPNGFAHVEAESMVAEGP